MKAHLLDILCCPVCHGKLVTHPDHEAGEELRSGSLECSQSHVFRMSGAIPRFVDSEKYAGSFGFEWTIHRQTQLDSAGSHESEITFRQKTGFSREGLAGKLVLDVGCGAGRFSDVAARWDATVLAVDLSHAVDAAYANLGQRPNVHILQADIFALPFREKTFDYIFSIGVLHHTPDTRKAFDRLPALLKPGGKIAIWVYSNYDSVPTLRSNRLRRVTTHLPKKVLYKLAHAAIPLYHVYRLPRLGLALQHLVPLSMHPRAEWRVLESFDWYSPKYQWKHSYEEVFPWFEAHRLTDIRVLGVPVSLQGTRPLK